MSINARGNNEGTGSQAQNSVDSEWLDEVFALLSNSRRRAVIEAVLEHENLRKSELVKLVTMSEYGMQAREVSGSSERQATHTSLHQTHLPRLEKAGVIDWDEDGDRISLGPKAGEMAEYIALIDGDDSLGSKLRRSISVLC